MPKFLKITLIVLGVLVLAVYIAFRFFLDFTQSEAQINARFADSEEKLRYSTYQVDGCTIHYAEIGADTLPTVLFIHGSPGTWDAYVRYMADPLLREKFHMISVDRIGYGKSDPGKAVSSLRLQAAYLKPILDQLPDSVPLIAVGHSYGGPVGLRMAMDYPDQVDGLCVIAGLADPAYGKRPKILGPFRSKALRWLLPPDMDVSNREIYPLYDELMEMLPMWDNIRANSVVIQGGKDMLVNPQHAKFIKKMSKNAEMELIELPKDNHLLIWNQYELVRQSILNINERLGENKGSGNQ